MHDKTLKFDNRRQRVKLCPCGRNNKDGKFAPFAGHHDYGYCHSCGETFLPPLPGNPDMNISIKRKRPNTQTKLEQVDYLPFELMAQTMDHWQETNFAISLRNIFPDDKICALLNDRFYTGASRKFGGRAVIFWYVDEKERVLQGKIIQYDPATGNRVKTINPGSVHWEYHNKLKKKARRLKPCLYGVYQLLYECRDKIVAIVEAEKTAIIMSGLYPNYIWMATGGRSGNKWYSEEVSKPLRGREIILFPDKGCYSEWKLKSKQLHASKVYVSDLLERTSLPDGSDLIDYYSLNNHIS